MKWDGIARLCLAVLSATVLLAAYWAAAEPTVWSQGFVNRVSTTSLGSVYGGDVYRWTGSRLVREASGSLLYEGFSSTPGDWRATAGTWSVSGGNAVGSSPSGWGFYEYGRAVPRSAGDVVVFETKLVVDASTRGGISLSSTPGDTGDPYTSSSVVATLVAKSDAGMEYAPPSGADTSIVPPSGRPMWLRIVYYTAGRYEAYVDLGDGWRRVHGDSTSSVDVIVRLVVKDSGEAKFDYVAAYKGFTVKFTNLDPGSVVMLYSGDTLVASAMADASGEAVVDVSGLHLPLRDVKAKVVVPPMTLCVENVGCSGAAGRFYAVAGEETVKIWYTKRFGDNVTFTWVRWVIPAQASVVNMTVTSGSSRSGYTSPRIYTLGQFKLVSFNMPGGVRGDGVTLYLTTPNIVDNFTLYSVDRGLSNPPDAYAGEAMRGYVEASDGSSSLRGARAALVFLRMPGRVRVATLTATTGADGFAVIGFEFPAHPSLIVALSYYSPNGTEWYFGIAEHPLKLATLLRMNAPPAWPEERDVPLVARLSSGEAGIGLREVRFQVYRDSSWVTIASAETNSTGYASASYTPPGPGVYRFRAVYGGEAWYSGSTSGVVEVVVKKVPLLTAWAPASAAVGRAFRINASLTYGGSPLPGRSLVLQRSIDGVEWSPVTAAVTGSDGYAYFTVVEPAAGTYYYRVVYAGDTEYMPRVSGRLTVEVGRIPVRITLEAGGPINATVPVELRALIVEEGGGPVTGAPVTMTVDGRPLCTATTDAAGSASCIWTPVAPGPHRVSASFPGDEARMPGSASRVLIVHKLSVRLSASPSGVAYAGRPVEMKIVLALANGTPLDGTVDYDAGPAGSGSVEVRSGHALLNLTFPSSGRYTVRLRYGGDAMREAASWEGGVEVEKVPVNVSVEAPRSVEEGGTAAIRVRVMDLFGEPVEGVGVVLWGDGVQLGASTTGSDGVAVIRVRWPGAGRLKLRVSVEGSGVYRATDVDVGEVEVRLAAWKIALPVGLAAAGAAVYLVWRRRRRGGPRGAGGAAAAAPLGPGGPGPGRDPGARESLEGLLEPAGPVNPGEEEPLEAALWGR